MKAKREAVAVAVATLKQKGFIAKASAETCAICTGMDGVNPTPGHAVQRIGEGVMNSFPYYFFKI